MSLESRIKSRIEMNRKRMAALSGNVLREQEVGMIEEETMLLERLLNESKEPEMEQEVQINLTLSVDADIDRSIIVDKITSLVELSGDMTVMDIQLKEEAEIYSNG